MINRYMVRWWTDNMIEYKILKKKLNTGRVIHLKVVLKTFCLCKNMKKDDTTP